MRLCLRRAGASSALLLLLPLTLPMAVLAQVESPVAPDTGRQAAKEAHVEMRPKWELGVGSVFYTQPDYIGSDEYRFRIIPFPWIVYRGDRFRADRESIQTKIFGTDRIRFDISTSGQIAVDSDDNDRRHGMPDLDWMFQIGPSLTIHLLRSDDGNSALEIDIPLRPAFAIAFDHFKYEGLVASPQIEYKLSRGPYQFTGQAGLEFQDSEYNDFFYGVDHRFVTPDRRQYDGKTGYGGVRVAAGVARYFFDRFYVGVFTRYYNLEGAAFENSPLTGSTHAFVGGVALGVVLTKSDEMVPVTAAEPKTKELGSPGTLMPAHDDTLSEPPPQQ
ncbi:MAG TPA: MipA/OmpV family protein [Candidatus Limnocylindrales bacterium]|nr:MipA/OmpV family protein [Candidatus Limnocylindrales bacterium]